MSKENQSLHSKHIYPYSRVIFECETDDNNPFNNGIFREGLNRQHVVTQIGKINRLHRKEDMPLYLKKNGSGYKLSL